MKFIVYGAGAVGSMLGGQLALDGHDVLLVCRDAHASAIAAQGGLKIVRGRRRVLSSVRATTALAASDFDGDTCVFLTARAFDTRRCVDELARVAPPSTAVVSFQNGVTNEDVIAERFASVHGGVCRIECFVPKGGHVLVPGLGVLIVGRHPGGADAFTARLCDALRRAGFDAVVSEEIVGEKWLKLTVNLRGGLNAIIDERDFASQEFLSLNQGLLREAQRVFAAAGIRAESSHPRVRSLSGMIDDFARPRPRRGWFARVADAVRGRPSVRGATWRVLRSGRGEPEDGHFYQPIIELGRRHEIPVPYHEVVLEHIERCHRDRTGPNAVRAHDLLAAVRAAAP